MYDCNVYFIIIKYKNYTEYKTVSADIDIDDSGLRITSNELDCEWFYKRKKIKHSLVMVLN